MTSRPSLSKIACVAVIAESKEVIGGYWIIQVRSREEAIDQKRFCHVKPKKPAMKGLVSMWAW